MTFALPSPRTPDPMAAPPLRWGMLGTGWIAERFVEALHTYEGTETVQALIIGKSITGFSAYN